MSLLLTFAGGIQSHNFRGEDCTHTLAPSNKTGKDIIRAAREIVDGLAADSLIFMTKDQKPRVVIEAKLNVSDTLNYAMKNDFAQLFLVQVRLRWSRLD